MSHYKTQKETQSLCGDSGLGVKDDQGFSYDKIILFGTKLIWYPISIGTQNYLVPKNVLNIWHPIVSILFVPELVLNKIWVPKNSG